MTDTIEFGTRELPRWNTISISGYHIREAGSTAVQELAFTIADGMAYVEAALARGLRVDDFAPAAELLLQQPQRLLRGDRQVPGRAPDLVAADDRALPRRERALDLDALPHPDGGRLPHRPAAAQQPDPGRHPGAGGRARRDAVAPHRRVRRGVGRAVGRGRPARPAPAADHRRGDRRGEHRRPARRVVVRRGADRRDRGRRLALPRRDRPARRHGRGDRRGLPAARDRRRGLPLPARARRRRAGDRRGQPLRRPRRGAGDPAAAGLGGVARGPTSPASSGPGASATAPPSRRPWPGCATLAAARARPRRT